MAAGYVESGKLWSAKSNAGHQITTNILRQWQLFKDADEKTLKSVTSFVIFQSPPIGQCSGGVGVIFKTSADSVYGVGHNCSHINIMGFHPDSNSVANEVSLPRKITALSGKHIKAISIGNLIGAAITGSGRLLRWGCCLQTGSVMAPNTPIKAARRKYRSVACGDRMMVALSVTGNVFVWGLINPCSPLFDGVLIVLDVAVKTIACGYHHVAMLDEDGLAYTWGSGERGQRGLATFTPKDTLEAKKVMRHYCRDVKCGPFSTFFLTNYHEIVACGYNGSPLSRNPLSALTGVGIREPMNDIDVAWTGNGLAQMAATTMNGEIYVWGPDEIPALTSDSIITIYSRWVITPGCVNVFYDQPKEEKPKSKPSKPVISGVVGMPHESGSSSFLSWVYEIQRSDARFYDSRTLSNIAGVRFSHHMEDFLCEENGRDFILNRYLTDLSYKDQDIPYAGEELLDFLTLSTAL